MALEIGLRKEWSVGAERLAGGMMTFGRGFRAPYKLANLCLDPRTTFAVIGKKPYCGEVMSVPSKVEQSVSFSDAAECVSFSNILN